MRSSGSSSTSTAAGAGLPVADRVAVFDNDGTLWCEKPMPIQLDFIFRRLAEMAQADPTLRDRQPWKAAHERDYSWLAAVVAERYAGDDTNVRTLGGGVLRLSRTSVSTPLRHRRTSPARHCAPDAGAGLSRVRVCAMVELLQYLEANGFANYIVSGGGRDFMRPISS